MKDESGLRWTQLPLFGAVGAGRQDEVDPGSGEFVLTPSAQAEQEAAVPVTEAPDGNSGP